MGKRLKEVMGKSKNFTLDSFWIEEELKNYLKRTIKNQSETINKEEEKVY